MGPTSAGAGGSTRRSAGARRARTATREVRAARGRASLRVALAAPRVHHAPRKLYALTVAVQARDPLMFGPAGRLELRDPSAPSLGIVVCPARSFLEVL